MSWRMLAVCLALTGFVFVVGILPAWLELRADRRRTRRILDGLRRATEERDGQP